MARITRDRDSKKAFLVLERDIPWQLYAAANAASSDFSQAVASGTKGGVFPLPAPARHALFALRRGGTTTILAEEHLPMSGGYNFRDMGGIPTQDGRHTAWGRLIRSDSLGHLTHEDLDYLASIPLASVVDFRTEDGMENSPDKLPASVQHLLHLPLVPGRLDPKKPCAVNTVAGWENFMIEMNRELVLLERNIAMYRKLFAHLQNGAQLPLLFHCAAGKDRTGLAAAYILFALGVEEEAVMRNYMESACCLKGKYDHLIERSPDRAPLFTVKSEYLKHAIAAMKEKCGSVDNYLVQALKVDKEKMRGLFLQ